MSAPPVKYTDTRRAGKASPAVRTALPGKPIFSDRTYSSSTWDTALISNASLATMNAYEVGLESPAKTTYMSAADIKIS